MSPRRAHNWVVEFQSHNRGHRNTRICPYNVFSALLHIPCLRFLPVSAYLSSSSSSLFPSLYSASAATALSTDWISPSWSHHLLATHAPDLHTVSLQRSRISRVAIYCVTVFCLFRTYDPISFHPYYSIAVSSGGYYKLPPNCCFSCIPVIRLATMCWKNPSTLPMRGGITHISDLNRSTACTTTLKTSWYLWDGALMSEYPFQLWPVLTILRKVPYHRQPIVIRYRQDPPQVFERCDRHKRPTVGLKGPLRSLLHIIFCQPPSLLLHYLGTLIGGEVPNIQGLTWHHHVTHTIHLYRLLCGVVNLKCCS